jgi:hypothetical protein
LFDYGWRNYMPDVGRWNGTDQLAEAYTSISPFAYVANNPVLMTDPDGRWMDDTGHITDTTGQTFGFHGSSYRPMLSFSTNDGMHTNEGAGVTDNGNNRIGQGPKPNIFKRIGNFVKNLFGWNKTKNKVEVGPAEKISEEQFSNEISSWQIISALLFNSTDPYSAIGNMGVGEYAEERENVGIAAMIFINPEAAAEGLERKTLSKAAMSKIWGAGLEYELKTVLHPGTLEKTIEKNWGKTAVESFDNIIDQLSSGKAGGNIHSLNKELKGYKAIDIPGTGAGRGAGRIIFKDSPNQVEIIGIVKGHDYNKILK